ncbi:hypothetical protein C0991_010019 [Blastosporella zonata]|nr:hypothetical protein C0991_010019 [Blastosporella zonata]
MALPLAAMQAIRAHSSHWEELCLALPSECYSSFFEHARTHKLPLLKRLTLLFHNAWPTSLLFTGRPLTTAPALSDISLINLPAYSSMLALPWDQITHFRGSLLYLADALDTLNEAPLESCTLTSSLGNPSTIDIPIHPPYLRDLILEGNTRALKYITVPALETLSIRTDGAFPTQQCVQFLRRSGCILQSLDIAVDFIAATDLVSCLACTPGLRELKIHNQNDRVHSLFGNFIMQRLTLGDHIILVPRLQRLDVLGCHCLFDTNVLASMLRSRWDVCGNGKAIAEKGRLDSFFLEASLTISKEIMHSPWIWRLVEEGMDIQVRALEVV